MFPLHIISISDERDLRLLKDFMFKQPQYYPNYREWIDGKCSDRIESGDYKTIIALSSDIVIGDCVYCFKKNSSVEIKNFRIDEHYRNRDIGHFLLKQIEVETQAKTLTLDVTVDNFSGVQFFIRNGFNIDKKACLYAPDQFEYLMSKDLASKDSGHNNIYK